MRGLVRALGNAVLAAGLSAAAAAAAAAPLPPEQPVNGPGGAAYPHASVRESRHGTGARAFWLFEPDVPRPASAPVVVFLHGWGNVLPDRYLAWIRHLVRRGNTVVYPRYQDDALTIPGEMTAQAGIAVAGALSRLASGDGSVRPQPGRLAYVGHSMGGVIAANLSARARYWNLPSAAAVMVAQPGITWGPVPLVNIDLLDLSTLPGELRLLAVVGDEDRVAFDVDARRILSGARHLPPSNRMFVRIPSDLHGEPGLVADHFSPLAPAPGSDPDGSLGRLRAALMGRSGEEWRFAETDALDWLGWWKLADLVLDAAFAGQSLAEVLTPEAMSLGAWSDGRPVQAMELLQLP